MTMPDDAEQESIIDAAMAVVGEHGWSRLTTNMIAARAQLSVDVVRLHFGSKYSIVRAFMRTINERAVAAVGAPDLSESPRDRLFEILMARFDALTPYRPAVRRLARASFGDPALGACVALALPEAMLHMLDAAGLRASGLEGQVKARVLALLWASVVRVWVRDDTPDLARTMAALDSALARIEPFGERLFPHDAATVSQPAD